MNLAVSLLWHMEIQNHNENNQIRPIEEWQSAKCYGGWGVYFIKLNGGQSPQDYDMIGLSLGWTGLEEYTTKLDFENYIKSFMTDYTDEIRNETVLIQDLIDQFWNRLS
jgi:hypothetical protein